MYKFFFFLIFIITNISCNEVKEIAVVNIEKAANFHSLNRRINLLTLEKNKLLNLCVVSSYNFDEDKILREIKDNILRNMFSQQNKNIQSLLKRHKTEIEKYRTDVEKNIAKKLIEAKTELQAQKEEYLEKKRNQNVQILENFKKELHDKYSEKKFKITLKLQTQNLTEEEKKKITQDLQNLEKDKKQELEKKTEELKEDIIKTEEQENKKIEEYLNNYGEKLSQEFEIKIKDFISKQNEELNNIQQENKNLFLSEEKKLNIYLKRNKKIDYFDCRKQIKEIDLQIQDLHSKIKEDVISISENIAKKKKLQLSYKYNENKFNNFNTVDITDEVIRKLKGII